MYMEKIHNLFFFICIYRDNDGCNEEFCFFNTALAFDRKGRIIAKYNKFNLYGAETKVLNTPKSPEPVQFETDFGATIGLLICFDINFKQPLQNLTSSVDMIAYPVAWVDELPFLTGKF